MVTEQVIRNENLILDTILSEDRFGGRDVRKDRKEEKGKQAAHAGAASGDSKTEF